jgi:hypothetical protein
LEWGSQGSGRNGAIQQSSNARAARSFVALEWRPSQFLFWLDYIINMPGYDFRKGHGQKTIVEAAVPA